MKVEPQTIQHHAPDLELHLIEAHLQQLDSEYAHQFDSATIASHLERLLRLSAQNPVEFILRDRGGGSVDCTVLAFDHPFELSLITGVLAGTGMDIQHGDVFTLETIRSRRPDRS